MAPSGAPENEEESFPREAFAWRFAALLTMAPWRVSSTPKITTPFADSGRATRSSTPDPGIPCRFGAAHLSRCRQILPNRSGQPGLDH